MEDKFKIDLNQNIWGLIVSLLALGLGEYYHLPNLSGFGWWLSLGFSLSVVISFNFYTWNYCKKKLESWKG
jgi:hypothetical protein